MKHSLHRRGLALVLLLTIVLTMLPVSATAVEASTIIVAWEYNDKTAEKVDVPATTGNGYLSHSSGDALAANSTGYFIHNKWNVTDPYWQLSGIDTSGKSHLVLDLRVQGSATGPKNWNVVYSTDAGDNWKTAGSYSIASASTTEKPSIEFPEDAISANLIIRLTPADNEPISSSYATVGSNGTNKIAFIRLYVMEAGYQTLAAFHFTPDDHPDTFPTPATEGWGYLNTTASGDIKLVSEKDEKLMAVSVKKWSVGHNWCMVFNTSDCADLVLEAGVLSSGTGPADWAVEYSVDLGENWVWVQSYHLANSTTKLQYQTIHLPPEAQSTNLLVRFRVDSDTALNGGSINKNQCTSRINHVTLTGNPGENHAPNPAAPAWPEGYGDTASDAIPSDAFVGWNFEEAKSLPAGAVKGWGYLGNSITTGPAYTGGGLAIKGWDVGAYWLLVANTSGYTGMRLTAKLGSSSTGPRDFALEYSTDNGATWARAGEEIRLTSALENYSFTVPDAAQAANCLFRLVVTSNQCVKATEASPATIASGGNSKINMVYMTGAQTGAHTADPVNPTYPADYQPAQEDIDEGFINAGVTGDAIAAWKFEDAAKLPANATTGWGTLSHITSAYCSFVSKALNQTGWTTNSYWQVIANTSGCTSMTFQLRTGSSSTGPKNMSLRYSVDLGETWVEFAQLTLTGSLKNYIVELPDAAQSTNLVIRVVVADDESIKGDVIKNGGSNKINNVAIYGVTGAGHAADPAEAQYPADWNWPLTYHLEDVYVPADDASADVSDFTYIEDDRRVIASWGGNANYAGDLKVYGDLITANDRMDGQAVMTVCVGNTEITPGFSTSSTNSTNYYLGSKSPCMGSGMTTVDEDGDGVPDTEEDEDGNPVEILVPTDDYLQMKVSTAKYTALDLSFRLRVSNAGPNGFTVRYSTDGVDFMNFGNGHYSYAYTGYGYGGATYDVSGEGDIVGGFIPMDVGGSYVSVELDVPKGCENAETLYIRLYASRIRQTPTVNAAGETVTTVSKISSVRIDTVELSGCPMIHPEISDWVRSDLPTSVPAGQQLSFRCGTDGATIYYSLDYGETVLVYDPANPPVLDTFPALVKVWSDSPDTTYDSVKTYYYFMQAQVTPVKAKPNGGAVPAGTEIKFTCATDGAIIQYSFDGGENWEIYDPAHKPILTEELLENDCTVMVMGTKEGYVNSPISVLTFTRRMNEFYNLYFGQLHSHTNLSDGAGSCEEAFYHAANEVDNLDFLAVTDHSNAFDNDLGASVFDGSMSSKWVYGHELADKYTREDFVGLYGYEMTWSNGLGHINTYNTAGFQSRTQTEFASYATALRNYYDALKSDANSLSQFNHPGTTFGNFEDYAYYDEVIDELITIIEVGNGEGTIGSSGYFPSYEEYTRALDLGWHVAPTNNQDNHKGHWGDSNTARSVVMADSLTRNNIYDAIRNRRVYATEDNDFSIYYTLDGFEMGTILTAEDVEETVRLKAVISDPTDTGSVKVDVLVNGGIVAATKSVPVRESTVEFDLGASYSYYYLRLTQADGNIAVTAPVWIGEVEAIGIKDVTTDADIPIQNEEMHVTLNLYNDEDLDLSIDSIVFTVDGQTVHTVDLAANGLTVLPAHSTASYTFPFTYGGIGAMTLNATLNGVYDGVDKQYNGVLQMKFLPDAMISNVIIDGTHYNDYVTGSYSGNMTKVVRLGVDNFARVKVVSDQITKQMLDDCQLLIITAPARRTMSGYRVSHFEDAFISMVADYVGNGGSVVLCGSADFNDSTACQTHTEMNKLLSAVGSTVRLRSDEVGEMRENNTVNYAPELKNYDRLSPWMAGAIDGMGFEVYSACSVNISNNAETAAVYPAQKIIWGNAETFSLDTKTDSGISVNSEELLYVQQPGDVIETVVQDTKAGGHIFVSGGVFMSDFNMENDENELKLNGTLMQNILAGTGTQLPVTPIAQMRQGRMGEVFCIEGWVTNGTANDKTKFFDTIYVQDATGGVTVYPYSAEGLQIGTKVQIVGYKDAYQDDIEIQVLRCKILDSANLNVLAPKSVKCENAMDYDRNGGQLLKTLGVITEVSYQGETVTQIRVKDNTGVATIFIDGYIYSGTTGRNDLADFCEVGAVVSAVGMCFLHPEAGSDVSACCLRVRDCDEVVLIGETCEHQYDAVVTEPTCTLGGYTTYTCDICGYSYVGDETDPLGHRWDDGTVTVQPTLTEPGVMTYTCTRCGAKKTEQIPPVQESCEHPSSHTEHVNATCTTSGYDKVICDQCGLMLSYTILPELGHLWNHGEVTLAPTATEPGIKTYTCRRCGAKMQQTIPPTGEQPCPHENTYHDREEATCTETGYDKEYCSDCGNLISETILPALGHDLIAHAAKDATCTAVGWDAYQTCTRCDYTTYREIPALGHDFVDHAAKEPTCTTVGWNAYQTCSRCSYSTYIEIAALGHDLVNHAGREATCTAIGWGAYQTCTRCDFSNYQEIPALGHDLVDHEAKEPTCTGIGWEEYQTCTRCDYTTYQELPPIGHNYVYYEGKAPTCTTVGWNAFQTCTRCDYSTYTEIAALGHDFVNHAGKEATCIAGGWSEYQTCTRCDFSNYQELPALGHDLIDHAARPATCTQIGWDAYQTCARCDYSTYEELPALGHLWDDGIVTTPATAFEDGVMTYTCTRCGAVRTELIPATGPETCTHEHVYYEHEDAACLAEGFDRTICDDCGKTVSETILPALGHDLIDHAAKDATCTDVGWYEYQNCSRCDYTTYREIPALGHDLVDHAAQEATCTAIGWEEYQTCTRCDYTTFQELPALGHDLVDHAGKAPTCTAIGWNAYQTCTRCDYSTYAEIAALGHDFVDHAGKAPTCTEPGWNAYQTCTRCDYTTYAEIAALGHDLVKHAEKAPTCTEVGWDAYQTCTRCDYSTYAEIAALGHDLVDHAAQEPTCTGIGWYEYQTCLRCDYTTFQELPTLGHDLVDHAGQMPTCTAPGWNAYQTCTRCDYSTYTEIAALGHALVNQAGQEPTCTEGGWEAYQTCTRCEYTTYQELPALGHDLVDHAAKEPTCTEVGWNAYQTCARCGCSTYAELAALGHQWGEGKVTTPATASEDGVKTYTCLRCGAVRTELIPATGETACAHEHAYPEHQDATCLAPGYDKIVCDDCGKVISETTLPALGHDLVDHAAKQATCTASGWNAYRTCTRCDYTTYAEAPALGHDLVDHAGQMPTCTASGWNAYQTCTRCDYSTYTEIAALGHQWDEGKITTPATIANDPTVTYTCKLCGETKTQVVPCPSRQFKDLDPTQWYHEGTDFVIANGLMNGVGDRIFDPHGTLTRAMLVTILYRQEGSPSVAGLKNPFSDVPAGQWYTDAVTWAADNGIVKGMSPTTFAPTVAITREQIAAILYRYSGNQPVSGDLSRFPDAAKVSGYAVSALIWAVQEGVVNGNVVNGVVVLDPLGNATRAQCATMLSRFLTKE